MTEIINFLQHKNAKDEAQIEKAFQKAHSLDAKLEALLQNKELQVKDHQLFLAFLTYADIKKIDVPKLFRDVIQLPKYKFEQHYKMNWSQVVKLSATFLSIVKQSSPKEYEEFRASLQMT
ncbi:MAG: hypothetical protein ABS882_09415 [Lysinibacillus sp.]